MTQSVDITPLPLLRKKDAGFLQCIRVTVSSEQWQVGARCALSVRRGAWTAEFDLGELAPRNASRTIFLPEPDTETETEFTVSYGEQRWSRTVRSKPVRRWIVHLVLHSHTDLGFTHPVSEVAKIHNENTDLAIRYCQETAGWPEGSRFKWTCEVSWQVQNYLHDRSRSQVHGLMEWVRKGSIGVAALYSGELTELLGHEEAVRSVYHAAQLRREFGIPCDTAMLSDVPGCTAGIVQIMAKAGITNFILADNNFLAPFLLRTDLPRPFFWQGADRTEILCWYTDHPFYAYVEGEYYGFHDDVDKVAEMLSQKLLALEQEGYPYSRFQIQDAFDNARLTFRPAEIVREWNQTWDSPKLVLSTAREFLTHMRAEHSGTIPRRMGDWTNWWGGIVTGFPVEESLTRWCHERIPEVELLATNASLRDAEFGYRGPAFNMVYDKLLAFDEHSGGGTLWKPKSDEQQEQAQREGFGFVHEAAAMVRELDDSSITALGRLMANSGNEDLVAVVNCSSHMLSGVVECPPGINEYAETVIESDSGRVQRSERSTEGGLRFVAENIPPHGYKSYRIQSAASAAAPRSHGRIVEERDDIVLENDQYRLMIDRSRGSCHSLYAKSPGKEMVRQGAYINEPVVYVPRPVREIELGKYIPELYNGTSNPGEFTTWPNASRAHLELSEDRLAGPCCRVEHEIEGKSWMIQEYRLGLPSEGIRIVNTLFRSVLDDIALSRPIGAFVRSEGHLFFRFAFDIPGGMFEHESTGMVLRPSKGQLTGSCHDFSAVQRWCRVAREDIAVVLTSPDSPLVDIGSVGLLRFKQNIDPDQSLLYVRAVSVKEWGAGSPYSMDQNLVFRFGVLAYEPSGSAEGDVADRLPAARFGAQGTSALRVVRVPAGNAGTLPTGSYAFCRVTPENVEIMTMKRAEAGNTIVIRLREVTGVRTEARFSLPGFSIRRAMKAMITEEPLHAVPCDDNFIAVELEPFAIETLQLELDYAVER